MLERYIQEGIPIPSGEVMSPAQKDVDSPSKQKGVSAVGA
jgi:hypothetical protein